MNNVRIALILKWAVICLWSLILLACEETEEDVYKANVFMEAAMAHAAEAESRGGACGFCCSRIGEGLVWDWDMQQVPHLVVTP